MVLIFRQLIAINFQKNQNFVQVGFVSLLMNIFIFFNCLVITTASRSIASTFNQIRTVPNNNYVQPSSYSNDYSSSSALTRSSSSYGNSNNDLGQSRVNSGSYGGGGDLGAGSNR
jgi:uncharacterized membrane protein YgcG